MSGVGKRGVGHWPQATAPILDSTFCDLIDQVLFFRFERESGSNSVFNHTANDSNRVGSRVGLLWTRIIEIFTRRRHAKGPDHTARLMPLAYVRPYVKRLKNDAAD